MKGLEIMSEKVLVEAGYSAWQMEGLGAYGDRFKHRKYSHLAEIRHTL